MYWFRYFLLTLFFSALALCSIAQQDTLVRDSVSPQEVPIDTVSVAQIDRFNYVFPPKDRPNQLLEMFLDDIKTNSLSLEKTLTRMGEVKPREVLAQGILKNYRPTWILVTAFLLFLAIGIVRLVFTTDFMLIVDAYYNERVLQQMSKEDNVLTSWPYIFLYLIFSLALGLFILLLESTFTNTGILNFENYLRVSLVVGVLFVVKILLVRFVSLVFEVDKLAREYVTVLYLVYFNSMLFLMPFLLVLVFVPVAYFKIALILFAVIASILFVYRFLRTFFRLFGNLRFSVFYLILYLCALEVAPILILVKLLSR
ncbi:DUF4271 domain-containing protein [Sphingobacterium psychroaquaticum]|nr:DUF4271 domain-containing protein [Sphingobacterium psychroaquaticum]